MIGTFLASEARILCRVLDQHGIDGGKLYREAGLDPALIKSERARFPFDRVAAAWGRAAQLTGKPHLGLELAKHYKPTDFHGLAVVFLASPSLRCALERLARYHVVVNTSFALRLENKPDRLDLVCSTVDISDDARRMFQDSRAAILVDLCRTASNQELNPRAIEFTYPEPADKSAHEAMFRCPLVFGASEWRLSFRSADVDRPFTASNRELALSNDHFLDEMVKSLRRDDVVSRVKLAMLDELASGTPSEDHIAKTVSMSTRSLQRRLAAEGTSYTQLLAMVRKELAEHYVANRHIPVTEISYMLGFSDVSSFSRAYKRWTGNSPAASRQREDDVSREAHRAEHEERERREEERQRHVASGGGR
jgi:AraC-like DNA-binding protein